MLSVFLVDDEELIREGLKRLISWEKYGFTIIGEAEDGEEALEQIPKTSTDIVITDLKMPFMGGIELAEKLKESLPGIKVIVLTGYDDFHLLQQSIRNGVMDYLLKPVGGDELIESLIKLKKKIGESKSPYPFEVESVILKSISKNDRDSLFCGIKMLFEDFNSNKATFDNICKVLHRLMVSVGTVLDSEGINLKQVGGEIILETDFFTRLNSISSIKENVNEIFNKIIDFKKGGCNQNTIYKIKNYIEKNYSENITLEMLASKFFINPSYLSQVFKSETDQNYNDYLSGIRVEKAKKLLTESNLSIQQISEMVGYNNSKYFSQLFKKYTGKQPSQYRQDLE